MLERKFFFFAKGVLQRVLVDVRGTVCHNCSKKEWKHLFSFSVKHILPLGASSIPFQHPVHIRS